MNISDITERYREDPQDARVLADRKVDVIIHVASADQKPDMALFDLIKTAVTRSKDQAVKSKFSFFKLVLIELQEFQFWHAWPIRMMRKSSQFAPWLIMILVPMFERPRNRNSVATNPHQSYWASWIRTQTWNRQAFAKSRTIDQLTIRWPMRPTHPISNPIKWLINHFWPFSRRPCVCLAEKLRDHLVRLSSKPSKTTFEYYHFVHTHTLLQVQNQLIWLGQKLE